MNQLKICMKVYVSLDIKTFVTEFGSTNYIRRFTQRSSFTQLGRHKLQFSSSHVKFDIWPEPNSNVFFVFKADEGDSGNGSEGFRMPPSKKGSAAVVGFTLKF